MASQQACYHCDDPVPTGSNYTLTINNEPQVFCCPACLAIAETITGNGLSRYYELREGSGLTPEDKDFELWDKPELQKSFVTTNEIDNTLTARLYIEGIHCTACVWLIEQQLNKLEGVNAAAMSYQNNELVVSWDITRLSLSDLMRAIARLGYQPHPYESNTAKQSQDNELRKLLKRIGILSILMMQIGMLSIGLYSGVFVGITDQYKFLLELFSFIFSIPLLFYGIYPFVQSALQSLEAKSMNMDVPISIAMLGLYGGSVYSLFLGEGEIYFDSIAMLCVFILFARYVEKRSRFSLTMEKPLLPTVVNLKVGDGTKVIELEKIKVGDVLVIKPGEIIAVDGQVISGETTVDESCLNGESTPVAKAIGDKVYAGSENHIGSLQIQVVEQPQSSLLNKIEQMAREAQGSKPRFQAMTDRIAGKFTVTVLSLAAGTYIYWFMQGDPDAFWVALSVLVISCPCALSLAAPTALSTVQFSLRNNGVLLQSQYVVEKLATIDDVIFDKTGTLTDGQFNIRNVVLLATVNEQDVLRIAASLEIFSMHPIAHAFANVADLYNVTAQKVHDNLGVEGEIEGIRYRIGSLKFCQQWHDLSVADSSQQLVVLCSQAEPLAVIYIGDKLREESLSVVNSLKSNGKHCEVLSGDTTEQVEKIAKELGLQDYRAACKSEDKLLEIQRLQKAGKQVMMVGDGINDAPVLSQSDVSVTLMHACDWVKNTSDIVIMKNSLSDLPVLFNAAHAYRRVVIQNSSWAIAYNLLAVPFAMSGMVAPYIAALGMSLSSIVVVLNSRRLKNIK